MTLSNYCNVFLCFSPWYRLVFCRWLPLRTQERCRLQDSTRNLEYLQIMQTWLYSWVSRNKFCEFSSKRTEVRRGAHVVDVGDEHVLLPLLEQSLEAGRFVEALVYIAVTGWVPPVRESYMYMCLYNKKLTLRDVMYHTNPSLSPFPLRVRAIGKYDSLLMRGYLMYERQCLNCIAYKTNVGIDHIYWRGTCMSPGLVERVDADVHVRVLAQNLLRVFVCVERVHEHQRHVRCVRFVQVLKTQQKSKR